MKQSALVLVAMVGTLVLVAAHPLRAESRKKVSSASYEALAQRLEVLEQRNQLLEQRNRAIDNQLQQQKAEIDALKHHIDDTPELTASNQRAVSDLQRQVSAIEVKQADLPFEVGFRTGWSESPYGMPGGFFYGAYLNHRLLTEEDGIPGGFISGELMAGVTQGNHANTGANLLSVLSKVPASTWLDTIAIEPTVQYHLDPDLIGFKSLAAVHPYVLAGPAMWINLLSTPIVAGSGQPGANYRHYDADFQGGGVFGLGTEVSLSALRIASIQRLLDKSFVGAEWRYNQMGNGQGFQQQTGAVGFGW